MANIKTTVDNMAKSRVMPEAPAEDEPKPMPEPTKKQIEDVIDRLAQPWTYGRHEPYHRRDCGVTKAQYAAIKAAYLDRLKREDAAVKEIAK